MAVQRKSQIPKAPERDLIDSIVDAPATPAPAPALTLAPAPNSPKAAPEAALEPPPAPQPAAAAPAQTPPQTLQPPMRRQRKPKREVYTSKMEPELKAWAMSFKPEEDFVEVVEQALWVLRLARAGQMDDAVAALEQSSRPIEH